jgi:3-hydroxyisobutyrate dehydrogenase-like beta-hydroxyacid dehydrogenase
MTTAATESTDHPLPDTLGLIGFGEAGAAFARGWRQAKPALALRVHDIKTDSSDAAVSGGKWREYSDFGVTGCATPAEALDGAGAVFSLVTADQAGAAAATAAGAMSAGGLFFDCNSCAPDSKRAAASVIEAAGMRYVDTAVMLPVHPDLHRTPMLICGPHSAEAAALLAALGMRADIVAGEVGRASAIKMMRSVMIKGLEALVLECVLSARKAGVDAEVLASLEATFPGFDWPARAAYMMERTTTHGVRRSAEMREVVKTVTGLGLSGGLSDATVGWQQAMGDLGLDPGPADYGARADAILAALSRKDDA